MRTQEQYLEKLKSMRHNIYLDGECIGRDDPRIVKASSAIRMTFSLVDNPEMHDLMTATSHITGKTINRFTPVSYTHLSVSASHSGRHPLPHCSYSSTGGCFSS